MQTKRLIIRKLESSDALELLDIRNSEFVLKYNCMNKISLQDLLQQLSLPLRSGEDFVLERKMDHQIIGVICLEEDQIRYRVHSIMISYYLSESFIKQGYMKEALQAVISYCFKEKNYHAITARVLSPNTASWHLLEKLGFCFEGELKQAVCGYQNIVYDDRLYVLFNNDEKAFKK